MCALGGRPKEEGGHKRIDISLDKETRRKLEKFKKQGGNVSQFIEREIKPVLERLDPAEQSVHVYRIEVYLSHEIINAVNKGDFEAVKILGGLAKAIDDYRKLAHIPPLTLKVEDVFGRQKRKFGFWEWLKFKSARDRLEEQHIWRPDALPALEDIAETYGLDWLKRTIEHDKEINKKLDELEKKS
jgi:hypothetical protein